MLVLIVLQVLGLFLGSVYARRSRSNYYYPRYIPMPSNPPVYVLSDPASPVPPPTAAPIEVEPAMVVVGSAMTFAIILAVRFIFFKQRAAYAATFWQRCFAAYGDSFAGEF